MYHELFIKMFIPPILPFNKGAKKQWHEFEEMLNLKIPDDYKWFINKYGSGCLNDLIFFGSPFSSNKNMNFFENMKNINESFSLSKEDFPEDFDYSLYPEKNGLLPFSYTTIGYEFFWNTKNWNIVVTDDMNCYEYEGPFFELLVNAFLKKEKVVFLNDEYLEPPFSFQPID